MYKKDPKLEALGALSKEMKKDSVRIVPSSPVSVQRQKDGTPETVTPTTLLKANVGGKPVRRTPVSVPKKQMEQEEITHIVKSYFRWKLTNQG